MLQIIAMAHLTFFFIYRDNKKLDTAQHTPNINATGKSRSDNDKSFETMG